MGTLTKSQIILAGDPKQLGPVLQSPISKMYGLEMSLLERLSQLPLYQRNSSRFQDHYDPMLVTKLGLCFFKKIKALTLYYLIAMVPRLIILQKIHQPYLYSICHIY